MATTMMDHITTDRHLKKALHYIADAAKTRDGMYVKGVNCPSDPEGAYKTFWDTKRYFGKDLEPRADGKKNRLAYHYKFSFVPGEVTEPAAWEILQTIAEKLMGEEYEALFAMHVDKTHLHGHLVFNSVSVVDGKKYHYSDGDWRRLIQPVVNEICERNGLSVIDLDSTKTMENLSHSEWEAKKNQYPNVSDGLRLVIDRCIVASADYDGFLEALKQEGFVCRDKKYLSLCNVAWGMKRARRTDLLGEEYTKERIQQRIGSEKQRTEIVEEKDHLEERESNRRKLRAGEKSYRPIRSKRIRSVRSYRLRYIRMTHFGRHRSGFFRHRYLYRYWKILRLWHDLQCGHYQSYHPVQRAALKDFNKLKTRIRVLTRYQIATLEDLDQTLKQLQGKAKVVRNHVKAAKELGFTDAISEETEMLKQIQADTRRLCQIRRETVNETKEGERRARTEKIKNDGSNIGKIEEYESQSRKGGRDI